MHLPGVDVAKFVKLKTMKEVIVNMDQKVDYASTFVRFQVCERLKNRSASSQCYSKKPSPEENLHSYQQIDCCQTPKNFC